MKVFWTTFGIAIAALLVLGGIYMVDIDQTAEGSLPDVDIAVESGSMPEYDVDVGDIDVGTEEVTVNVPTIDIESPEEEAASSDS